MLGVRWSEDSAQVWTQSISGTDNLAIAPTSGRLPARPIRIAVPDPARDRVLVFLEDDPIPGLQLETHPEVWALGLAEPMRWEALGATDYSCASVTYTTGEDSLFLHGSGGPPWRPGVRTISAPLSDPTQSRVVSDQAWPPTSMGAVLVRDASRQRWLLVGGRPDYAHLGGSLDSLWELRLSGDLADWRHLAVEGHGPVPSGSYACAVDESDGTLYVLNGWDQATGTPTGPRELWALRSASPPRWELVHSAAAGDWPLLHEAPAFLFDPVRRRLTAFSFRYGVPAISASTIWELAVDAPPSWTHTVAEGTPPTFFQGGTAAFDPAASRIAMVAENGQIAVLETEPVLRWELTPCLDPGSGVCLGVRMGMRGVFDPIGRRLLEMGGFDPWWDGIGTEDALFEVPAGDSVGPARRLRPEGSQGWQGVPTYAYDGERDALLVFGDRSTFGPGLQEMRFDRSGRAVATPRASAALGDRNALRWAATPNSVFRLWRLAPGETWTFVAELRAPASGELTFDDRAIEAGARYGYRITSGTHAESPAGADVWLATPTAGTFALSRPWPNPSRGALNLAFTLAAAAPAELEAFDLAGRRVWARRWESATAGPHHVAISPSELPRSGLYFVRLRQAGVTATRRVVIAR
jgi:hypothetical protein